MKYFAFLPEIVAFLLLLLTSIQDATVGPFLVLAQLGLMAVLIAARPQAAAVTLTRFWPLLLLPLVLMASSAWSVAPDISARYGFQLLLCFFIAAHVARLTSPRRMLVVFVLAHFVFLLMCIASGRQGPSAAGMVLIGLTGSKNQISHDAQLLFMASFALLFVPGVGRLPRITALLGLVLGTGIVAITQSATAVVTTVLGAGLVAMFVAGQALSAGARLAAILAAVALLIPITFLGPEIQEGLNYFLFDTLGKDPTLTGRTLLWEHADALIAQRPLLGFGYDAIWLGDSSETIGLLRLTGMTDGRGFHFHNSFRQVTVDAGFVGLAVFISLLVAIVFKGFSQFLLRPRPETSFFFALSLLTAAQAYTELIYGPFSPAVLVLCSCAVYAYWRPEQGVLQEQPFGWTRDGGSFEPPANIRPATRQQG